jgi:hypothetical protein
MILRRSGRLVNLYTSLSLGFAVFILDALSGRDN